ncbi:class I SAM-dependent methyltransferase [Arenibaculum sp.]|jgi:SAM-dependent methyltransferase|uniref:class I SAM-dependent methyltransferase n=1 Tax=Arenibaculum sp. TaxID=2865862 RepID=UPI002E10A70D|nr:class I SAM-dependent methyltransferase [Arenibaculum sp.]
MPDVSTRTPSFDPAAAEAFAGRIGTVLDSGAVAVMMSIGYRAGLFETMAALPLSTSDRIAAEAGLAERYVREWLAVMVTGRIVAYDPRTRGYSLPPEHAACLTRAAPLGNMAVYAQHVALLGAMQEPVLDRFRNGGGTSYGDYPCFHQIMAEDSAQTVTASLFDAILPLADGVVRRLGEGIDVMDAGCGRGSALLAMARRFPASRFVGWDLCEDAIAFAAAAARDAGLGNIRFEVRDLTGYDEKGRFDFVTTFDAVHDQKDPQGLIRSLHGALRPGGVYLMQDIGGSAKLEDNLDFPMASLLYAVSCAHCTPISLGQGGAGFGTMWGWETAEAMLREAGFREVKRHVLAHDPMNVWFVAQV